MQTTADRYRDRIRARFNVEAKATDNILVGIGLATDRERRPALVQPVADRRVLAQEPIDLDLAYFDWKFASWGNLIGGKMKQPFFKPGAERCSGTTTSIPKVSRSTFNRGIWFGTAYNYWINESVRRRDHGDCGHHAGRRADRREAADRLLRTLMLAGALL